MIESIMRVATYLEMLRSPPVIGLRAVAVTPAGWRVFSDALGIQPKL